MTESPTSNPKLLVADLDGTLLHDAEAFEDRSITRRSIDAINRAHDAGYLFAIATARPVSTGLRFAHMLPADAVVYLNGALIDFAPGQSDFTSLTSSAADDDPNLVKIGFPSDRACEVCRMMLEHMPGLQCGIVMNDVRYTNFDVRQYWKTQEFRYTNFQVEPNGNVPVGIADKITVFPDRSQWDTLRTLIPDDFTVSISEGVMWMLMNPQASKEHALTILCDRLGVKPQDTVAFGDDLIDINMMRTAGRGVAVANANPNVLDIADEVCPSNNDDGVAQWIEARLQ